MTSAFDSFDGSALGARIQSAVDAHAFGTGGVAVGAFWALGGQGIINYDEATDSFTEWARGDAGLPSGAGNFRALALFNNRIPWILTDESGTEKVYIWDPVLEQWDEGPATGFSNTNTMEFYSGQMWVASGDKLKRSTGTTWSTAYTHGSSAFTNVATSGYGAALFITSSVGGQYFRWNGAGVDEIQITTSPTDWDDFADTYRYPGETADPPIALESGCRIAFSPFADYFHVTVDYVLSSFGASIWLVERSSATWPIGTAKMYWREQDDSFGTPEIDDKNLAELGTKLWAIGGNDDDAVAAGEVIASSAKVGYVTKADFDVVNGTKPTVGVGDWWIVSNAPRVVPFDGKLHCINALRTQEIQTVAIRDAAYGVINSVDAGDPSLNTFTITIGSDSVSVAGTVGVAQTAAALRDACNASGATTFQRYTWIAAFDEIVAQYGDDGGADPPTNISLTVSGAGTGTVTDFAPHYYTDHRISGSGSNFVEVAHGGSLAATTSALAAACNAKTGSGSGIHAGTWAADSAVLTGTGDRAGDSLGSVTSTTLTHRGKRPGGSLVTISTLTVVRYGNAVGVLRFDPATETWTMLKRLTGVTATSRLYITDA